MLFVCDSTGTDLFTQSNRKLMCCTLEERRANVGLPSKLKSAHEFREFYFFVITFGVSTVISIEMDYLLMKIVRTTVVQPSC